MTRIRSTILTCGACGKSSEYSEMHSCSDFSGRNPDLDLRPPGGLSAYMRLWLQLCPDCGYVSWDIKIAPDDIAVYRSDPSRIAPR